MTLLIGLFALVLTTLATPATAAVVCTFTVPAVTENVTSAAFDVTTQCTGVTSASFPNPSDDAAEQSDTGKGIVGYTGSFTAFTYKAKVNAVGPDTFTLLITGGAQETNTITVNVPTINGRPILSPFTASSVGYNSSGNSINVATSASVQRGATSYTVSNASGGTFAGSSATANGGTVSINSSGLATYAPPTGRRGNDTFYVQASNGSGTSSAVAVTVPIGNPTLTISLTGSGTQGATLSGVSVTASGGATPYSCATSVSSGALPGGTAIGSGCAITGTPSASGTFNFTVAVTDSSTGTGGLTQTSGTLTLVISAPAPVASSFTYGSTVGYNTGAASATTIDLSGHVTNSPTGYAVGSTTTAQGGSVSVNASGMASYTPAVGFRGNDSFTFTATSGGGTSSPATVTVAVGDPTLVISLTGGSGTQGAALSGVSVGASGGKSPYTCGTSVATGALPGGVSLNNGCSITGTPSASGTFNFTVTVTDGSTGAGGAANGFSQASGTLSLSIASGLPSVTGLSPNTGAETGGISVVITGTSLNNATAVKFGGVDATGFINNGATQITATAPAGTGTVDVTVTTGLGTSATSAADQFTYVPAPTVTAVSPVAGPTASGTSVTISGTNFSSGATVRFGATAATGVTVNSANQITATAPAGSGTVDVTVTTVGGTSATSAADQYAYTLAPTVSTVSPAVGPIAGGTSVTIAGANFSPGSTVRFGATTATGVTVNSASQIVATAPTGSGTVDVTVTTVGGTSATSAGDQFTYVAAPTISGVAPSAGPVAGGAVVITGNHFTGATAVTFDGVAGMGLTVVSDTQISVTAPAHAVGAVDVVVVTPGGSVTAAGGYTYVVAPTVSTVTANTGPATGGTVVVITGSGFSGSPTVTFGGAAATGVTVDSSTQITATTPAHAAGAVTVLVTTTGGPGSLAAGFTFVAAPMVSNATPNAGPLAGGTSVVIAGTGFTPSSTVTFDGASASVVVDSATQITATAPAHAAGAVDIVVTTIGGSGTKVAGFTYVGAPTISGLAPTSGPAGGGTSVVITGANFTNATAVKFGATNATTFSVDSATQITATTPVGSAGVVGVSVATAGGTGSLASSFTYIAAPTVTALSPATGPATGANTVVLTGTGFTSATGVKFGATAATGVVINSDTQITATAPAGSGTVNVQVTATGGVSATGAGNSYTYVGAPTVSGATPSAGPLAGGTSVVIAGTGFTAGSTVTFDGASASVVVDSATQITATAPAHAAGPVDIVVTTIGGSATRTSGYTYVGAPTISGVAPTSGPASGGTSVVITGGDFTGVTAVKFGATNAAGFVVDSATQITATTPAGSAGVVGVSVTAAGGTGSLASSFTYIAAPTVTALSPATGPVVGGTSVTLTGTGFASATAVKFGATSATGVVINSDTQITATAPAGTGTINVQVTATGGTSATGPGNTYLYAPVPTVSAVSPTAGPLAGGNSVVITGAGFTGASGVTFGATAATGVIVNSDTQITATAPAGSAGTVSVSVTTAGGTGTLAASYRYAAIPAVASLSVSGGPTTGGTSVVLTGTDFTGASGVKFGAANATSFVVDSATQITATAPAGTGTVNVTVIAPGGTSTASAGDAYTYVAAPTVTGLSPTFGPIGGGTSVVLTGAGFTSASAVKFGATNAASFTVVSATQITATSPAGTGTVNVTVTTAGGISASGGGNAFTYGDGPAVTSLSPASGPLGGGTSVQLTGANFTGATAVRFGSSSATSVVVDSATQITATAPAGSGSVNVTVTTSVGTSATGAGSVYAYVAAPTVTVLAPSTGLTTGGTSVVLSGSGFTGATGVTFGATAATAFTVDSDSQITATAPASAAGAVNVVVTSVGGNSIAGAGNVYTYATPVTIVVAGGGSGLVGQVFSGALTATGGRAPYNFAVTGGALPAGVSLGADGTLSGTPTIAGVFTFTATATDADNVAGSSSVVVTITAAPLVLAGGAGGGQVRVSYSAAFSATGGVAPYRFALTGALPPGLSFDGEAISGTPTTAGSYDFTVTVTDSAPTPVSTSQSYTVVVAPSGPLSLSGGAGAAQAGVDYSASFAATGGVAPYHFGLSGALPAGLSFDGQTISGVTSSLGSYGFTVTVTDSASTPASASQSFTLVVEAPTPPAADPVVVIPTTPGEPVTIDLSDKIDGAYTGIVITRPPNFGTVQIQYQNPDANARVRANAIAAPVSVAILYTPNPGYVGPDSFSYAAVGPGGQSPPARVIIGSLPAPVAVADTAVAGSAQPVTVPVTANDTGEFDSVAIVNAPTYGTAVVSGLSVVYTSKAGFSGLDTFTYALTGPGGVSAPAEVRVTVNPQASAAPPVSVTILAGQQAVVDLTNGATGGPFIAAAVVSMTPSAAGTTAINSPAAGRYSLTFTPDAAFSGQAIIRYTLSNATSVSAPGTVTITVTPRPDPTLDPEVKGLVAAQDASARRFANAQIGNFNRRLEQLHNGGGVGGGSSVAIQGGVTDRTDGVEARERMRRRAAYGAVFSDDETVGALRQPAQLRALAAADEGRSGGGDADDASQGGGKPKRWGVWATGNADFGLREAFTGQSGFKFTTDGLTLGADYRVNPRLAVGMGLGYGRDSTKVGHGGTKSRADSLSGGLYASYQPTERGFIDGVIGYGGLNFDSRRLVTATNVLVDGDRDGDQLFASLTAGIEHHRGALMVSPYGRVGLTRSWLDAYTEVGGGVYGLSYQSQTLRSLTAALGLRADYRYKVAVGELSPRLRVEYTHDFEGADKAGIRYADWLNSPTYRLAVDGLDRNQTRLELGFDLRLHTGLNIGVDFDNTLSPNNESHGLRLSIQSPFE